MENLHVSDNKRYHMKGSETFFWLADTGWLIFGNISEEEAYNYLKNRADKGFNVIQAVLVYSTKELESVNKMYWGGADRINDEEYWQHVERIIKMADKLGLYMALLPSWGSLLKNNLITSENVLVYGRFLAERLEKYSNIIWVLGGDIKADNYVEIYRKLGRYFKEKMPDKLITFHPFGRCASSMWFADDSWLDFNMFQSGHRRYGQRKGDGDYPIKENTEEDNWRFVEASTLNPLKPVIDDEPIYENIPQGLHDPNETRWNEHDVRRYAYWSVFAGSFGHSYGHNDIMQFIRPGVLGSFGADGMKKAWWDALEDPGFHQMKYLKYLMLAFPFFERIPDQSIIAGANGERYDRAIATRGNDYLLVYNYSGRPMQIDLSKISGDKKKVWWMSAATGKLEYLGEFDSKITSFQHDSGYMSGNDQVLIAIDISKEYVKKEWKELPEKH